MGIEVIGGGATGGGGKQFTNYIRLTTSQTWTHPDGPTAEAPAIVRVVIGSGGGGGGSGACSARATFENQYATGGGGGGGGNITSGLFAVTGPVAVVVGAGGIGGAARTQSTVTFTQGLPGTAGGATSFGNFQVQGGGAGPAGKASHAGLGPDLWLASEIPSGGMCSDVLTTELKAGTPGSGYFGGGIDPNALRPGKTIISTGLAEGSGANGGSGGSANTYAIDQVIDPNGVSTPLGTAGNAGAAHRGGAGTAGNGGNATGFCAAGGGGGAALGSSGAVALTSGTGGNGTAGFVDIYY